MNRLVVPAIAPLLLSGGLFASADSHHDPVHDLLMHIGLTILVATILAYLGHVAKQPLILAYLAAGALIGPNFGLGLIKTEKDISTISELGLASGHISPDILSIIIFTFVITSILAPYLIKYNQQLQGKITRVFEVVGLRDKQKFVEPTEQELNKDIALLGFFKVASSFVTDAVEDTGRTSLKDKIVVVDFNQTVHSKLKSLGIPAVYGDIGHIDTLHHIGLHHTKVAISTIPDTILVGTSNTKLIKQIEDIAPHAKIIVTAENPESALKMYEAGADYVFLPRQLASAHLMPIVRDMLATSEEAKSPAAKARRKKAEQRLASLREKAISELRQRHEIIS